MGSRSLGVAWLACIACSAAAGCGRFGFGPGDDSVDPDAAVATTTMWLIGGSSATTMDQVWRTDDGIAWSHVGSLPAARSRGALYYSGARLVFAGGGQGQRTAFDQVWASDDGVTWSQVGTLPVALAGMAYASFQGRMWMVGGETASQVSVDVVRSSVDGTSWTVVGNTPYPVHGGVLVVLGDRMYLVAGHDGAFLTDVISTADGITWSTELPIVGAREYHGTVAHFGDLWLAGGTPSMDDVRVLTPSAWARTSTLSRTADHAFLASYRDRLWLISGADADVLSSSDGATWVDEGDLPGTREYFNALVTPPL